MCELLGLCFNQPVKVSFSFSAFLEGSDYNPDGWGIGFHPDGKGAMIFKEALPGDKSELAGHVSHYPDVRAANFVAHIRKASKGTVCYSNSHPFNRHHSKTEIVFAHNGTLRSRLPYPPIDFQPTGTTDSEAAFCHLLWKMNENDIFPRNMGENYIYSQRQIGEIYKILKSINQKGSFNSLFSDGTYLFAYRGYDSNTLFMTERKPPFTTCTFRDNQIEVDLRLSKSQDKFGYIIATVPLTDEEWVPFKPGQLIVFRAGTIVTTLS